MKFGTMDDPFVFDNTQEPSLLPLQPLEKFSWDDDLPELAQGAFDSPLHLVKDGQSLHDLNVFGDEKLEDISSLSAIASSPSSSPTDHDDIHSDLGDISDIWSLENISTPPIPTYELRSWDVFPDFCTHRSGPAYLSEAGPSGFDAALVYQATKNGLENSGRVARTDAFISALFKLGLGWNSVFFRFNEQSRKFEKHIRDVRISGISLPSLDQLIDEFTYCGTRIRKLRRFIATLPNKEDAPDALASLSRAIFVQLYSIEDQLGERYKLNPSLLETQILFRRAGRLIKCLADVVEGVAGCTADVKVISTVFTKCDQFSHEFVWLADIFHEVMANVAGPWLFHIAKYIGLRPETVTGELNDNKNDSTQPQNIEKDGPTYVDSYREDSTFHPKSMPTFINPELAEAIYESGKGLQLLRSSQPGHPLSEKYKSKASISLSLEWGLKWEDIDRIQQKASDYESELRAEILRYQQTNNKPDACNHAETNKAYERRHEDIPVATIFELPKLPDVELEPHSAQAVGYELPISSSKLYRLIAEGPCVDLEKNLGVDPAFGPPLVAALSLSFAPVLSAQTRLINFSCLQLLFKGHKVKDHFKLQQRFQLLGDGGFLLRLSLTLFDPDMQSGERKAGVARGGSSTGLRLGSRDTWPPASSELRLVLTGLLSESYAHQMGNRKEPSSDLPGGLSFAIRDLTGEELSKCKNPNSLEALDFLRMQYTAPPVLEEVITPRSLRRYDLIFKHLLRLTRMLSVSRDLVRGPSQRSSRKVPPRDIEQKFRFEASHFVQAVSDYCFQVGVSHTWHSFELTLSKIEECIDDGDIDGTISHAKSLRRLREYHENVLDQILFALFLSKKHLQARRLLDDIFRTILAFAVHSKSAGDATRSQATKTQPYERSVRELFSVFRKQVIEFVRYLRGLDGVNGMRSKAQYEDLASWGSGRAADIDVNGIFDHLLIRLDIFEFYK